jgi:outer membrane protein insertion porin family
MSVFIDKGAKIKIQDINFTGNKALSGKKLEKQCLILKKSFLDVSGKVLNT